MNASAAVLSVRRLQVHYPLVPAWPWQPGGTVRAVDDLQFDLQPGEALGILGEQGSGKSTLARVLGGAQSRTAGEILLRGNDVRPRDEAGWKAVRRGVQVVSADTRLAPSDTAFSCVEQSLSYLNPDLDEDVRSLRVSGVIDRFGLSDEDGARAIRELSPPQRSRVLLARAAVTEPSVLICDDLVAGLDSPDAEVILGLLAQYRSVDGTSIVFTSRDPATLRPLCDRVLVMYMGRLMEQATTDELFERPRHPYTRVLLSGKDDESVERPHPANPPSGCVFRTRCEMADSLCARQVPHVRKTGASHSACHFVADNESVAA